jgi:hypothetical protein
LEPFLKKSLEQPAPIILRNVGVLEDEHLALLAYGKERVRSLIDAARDGAAAAGDDSYTTLADRYADAASVWIAPADCGLPDRTAPGAAAAAKPFKGHRYETIGLAYRVTGEGETNASVALHYADEADAEEDVDLRERAARDGFSIVAPGTNYDELFELADASTDGSDVVLELEPAGDTLALWRMLTQEDLLFALC